MSCALLFTCLYLAEWLEFCSVQILAQPALLSCLKIYVLLLQQKIGLTLTHPFYSGALNLQLLSPRRELLLIKLLFLLASSVTLNG